MKKLFLSAILLFIIAAGVLHLIGNAPKNTINIADTPNKFGQALTAASAIIIDKGTGAILFEKDCHKRCFPASTTKILTALVAMENGSSNEMVTVGDEANFPAPGSSIAGIRYGEKLTLGQLLHCLLIPSGNDAAYTIAAHIGEKVCGKRSVSKRETVEAFCKLMNEKAKKLGAKDSSFINPDGFHNPDHYTTAYDLSLIAREAMKNKEFKEIVIKTEFRLPDVKATKKNGKVYNQARMLANTNKLLLPNDGNYFPKATGIKTGHTDEAGYCLVSSAQGNGKGVIAVVLNSTEHAVWSDSKKLLEWGLNGDS